MTVRATTDCKDISAVILVGGMGTRLRSVVQDRPKVLAQVGGRPFLSYLLDQLAAANVPEVVLCTGYLGSQIEDTFGDHYRQLRIRYSPETAPLGTGGALRAALPLLGSDLVLAMNGDSFCDVDLAAMLARHQARDAEATLALAQVPDTRRFGRVKIDDAERLLGFEEKGSQFGPGWINAGIYLLSRRLLESIPATGSVSLERDVFPVWIGRGLYGQPTSGDFLDIGTPETYEQAEAFFARYRGALA